MMSLIIRPALFVTIFGDKGETKSSDGYFLNYINSIPIESIDVKRMSKCFTYFYEKGNNTFQ